MEDGGSDDRSRKSEEFPSPSGEGSRHSTLDLRESDLICISCKGALCYNFLAL